MKLRNIFLFHLPLWAEGQGTLLCQMVSDMVAVRPVLISKSGALGLASLAAASLPEGPVPGHG